MKLGVSREEFIRAHAIEEGRDPDEMVRVFYQRVLRCGFDMNGFAKWLGEEMTMKDAVIIAQVECTPPEVRAAIEADIEKRQWEKRKEN